MIVMTMAMKTLIAMEMIAVDGDDDSGGNDGDNFFFFFLQRFMCILLDLIL